ncbi:AAA family ATPase [Sulfitobacter sp. JBTF-M27]|uniref:AAA family ATPase n=1 Tax=Sulfitobacter sediminilitoris TaxID=2698830 RepID=A0A6P0CF57_9RHOB|nr:adenylate/guanylate cyclase domain-containing protein [Sulfitobacter sediminilitoris]NEK24802.1 AAA family ATPase [Sulfitobacter sediminilitoris]
MSDIANWLRKLGLADYVEQFEREAIDVETVGDLAEEDLRELGLPMGPRKKLLRAIAALNDKTDPLPPSEEPAEERRQVAVLFSDICGFTRLSAEIGAEETHKLLAAYFARADAIIASFGGTVDKHIGDSVMAIFGAPVAHGNDPERAVRAAAAIQEIMPDVSTEVGREVQVHIGVASGQVVASGAGGDGRYTVTGSSVNLASRLTDRAGPDEILLSDSVHDALGGIAAAKDIGSLELKGIVEPVRAWQFTGLIEAGSSGIDRPFVGREAELEQLSAALDSCGGRRAGQVILLRGEAGIGKTRLTEEVERIAERCGYASHRVLILDFGAGKGQDAPRALVRSLLDIPSPSQKAERVSAAERALADGWVSPDQSLFLNDLLDLPQAAEQLALYDAMENSRRNQGKAETLAALVRASSEAAPRLLLIEDMHWAEALVVDQLAELVRAIADRPVLVVMTSRIEGDKIDAAWRAAISPTPMATLDLRPLLPGDSLKLASEFFDVASQFARSCVERADGNPLFLEQLLRGAEAATDNTVPGSVQSIVQARLDALDAIDKKSLQAASALGQRFDLEALRHLIGDNSYTCSNLIERHLVRPQGEMFLFAHALVREGVYGSLLTERRRELHRRAADWYRERDLVLAAEHLDRADDEEAAGVYLAAAEAQSQTLNFNVAARLAARGLELAENDEIAVKLACGLAEAQLSIGETLSAIESYRAALQRQINDGLRRSALIGLAGALRIADRREEALEVLDRADEIEIQGNDIGSRVQVHYLRGSACFTLGRLDECMSEHQRALELARLNGLIQGEAQALSGLGDALYLSGRMRTASERFKACVTLAQDHGLARIEVANLYMVGWTLMHLNDDDSAMSMGSAAETMGTRLNHMRAAISGCNVQAHILRRRSEHGMSLERLEKSLAWARQIAAVNFESDSLYDMALNHLALGDREKANRLAMEALGLVRDVGLAFLGPTVLAVVALSTDDADERRSLLDEAEAVLDSGQCVSHNQLYFPEEVIPDELARGAWDAAERHALRLARYTAAEPLPRASQIIEATKELVAWGRGHRTPEGARRLQDIAADARATNLNAFAEAVSSLGIPKT